MYFRLMVVYEFVFYCLIITEPSLPNKNNFLLTYVFCIYSRKKHYYYLMLISDIFILRFYTGRGKLNCLFLGIIRDRGETLGGDYN